MVGLTTWQGCLDILMFWMLKWGSWNDGGSEGHVPKMIPSESVGHGRNVSFWLILNGGSGFCGISLSYLLSLLLAKVLHICDLLVLTFWICLLSSWSLVLVLGLSGSSSHLLPVVDFFVFLFTGVCRRMFLCDIQYYFFINNS